MARDTDDEAAAVLLEGWRGMSVARRPYGPDVVTADVERAVRAGR